MTEGLEVLVHDVIDAITTSPFLMVVDLVPTFIGYADFPVFSVKYVGNTFSNALFESESEMRS
jgi:hypothetical protein